MGIEKMYSIKYQRTNMWMTREDIEVIRRCTEYAWYVMKLPRTICASGRA